jgi:kynurenine formamidase
MIRYEDLPAQLGAPPSSSWGLWGTADRLGAINRLTPERVRAAQRHVRSGEVVALDLPIGLIDPPLFGRTAPTRQIMPLGPEQAAFDEVVDGWNAQSGSQWDGFGHVAEPGVGSYNGLSQADHGVDAWARHGVAGRGLLVDLPRWWAAQGVERDPMLRGELTSAELAAAISAQNVTAADSLPQPGDILVIRTGWLSAYRALSSGERMSLAAAPNAESFGLAGTEQMAAALWDAQVAAVASDNPSLEAWPPRWPTEPGRPASLHRSLLARLGIPIGELWDLDLLADKCAQRGSYAFFCVSVPTTLPGALASPANAVAIL